RASQTGGPFASLLYGVALAALALVRAALLPFGLAALLWFILRCRGIKRGWLCALLSFLGFLNGLVPWTLRNLQSSGQLVPIVDSTYYHLWAGNNANSDGGPQDERVIVADRDLGPTRADLEKMDPKERNQALGEAVLAKVQKKPARV